MSGDRQWWQQDLPLRSLGIGLALIAVLAIKQLLGMAHAPHHQATFVEMGLAAVGFLGLSLGGALLCLGAHIHDEVEIAERWRTTDRQQVVGIRSEQLRDRVEVRSYNTQPATSPVSGPWSVR